MYLEAFAGIYYLLSGSTRLEKFIYDNNSDNKVARKVFALVIDHNDNLYFTTDEAIFFQFKN
ncbi:hypothetical protein SKUN_0084 [Spiroplasma kunkelii CR2-3x]|uniref:Uncharacterized protein n=1 Tax=Spiroplasma kunkelii CR2-3x TaxID=273035 RepID=A0A0K2JEK1_SPIKU|nr:hypothetical protein [Spiroplasma kunkelii]ALA97009.1 hypothetical protein SKUN_0084 [Spiroplasma kunkelii CR2-3x]